MLTLKSIIHVSLSLFTEIASRLSRFDKAGYGFSGNLDTMSNSVFVLFFMSPTDHSIHSSPSAGLEVGPLNDDNEIEMYPFIVCAYNHD